MASVYLTKVVELPCGVQVEFEGEYDLDYTDSGIGPYEYWGARGVHHDYGWEIQECTAFGLIDDVRTFVADAVPRKGKRKQWRHKRALLRKQATREVAKLTDEEVFDEDEIYAKAPEDAGEDNYDPRDEYEPEDRYLDYAYEDRYATAD